jgi:type IV secretion system protein VirB1
VEAQLFYALLATCAPQVHPTTASALVAFESGGNPFAIGVVGGALTRQPTNRAEAVATARALQAEGWSFSVGLGQINVGNFARLRLTIDSAFDACANLKAMQAVLEDCFGRSDITSRADATRLRNALSCYYSGNFATGYRYGYVRKVVIASAAAISVSTAKEQSCAQPATLSDQPPFVVPFAARRPASRRPPFPRSGWRKVSTRSTRQSPMSTPSW